nr:hypothetical protein [Frankia sp. ArI3]
MCACAPRQPRARLGAGRRTPPLCRGVLGGCPAVRRPAPASAVGPPCVGGGSGGPPGGRAGEGSDGRRGSRAAARVRRRPPGPRRRRVRTGPARCKQRRPQPVPWVFQPARPTAGRTGREPDRPRRLGRS